MYKHSEIVNRFMFREFKEIPKLKLWEFIGPIITLKDHEILRSWMQYFRSVKVPYIVVKKDSRAYHEHIIPGISNIKWLICERKV